MKKMYAQVVTGIILLMLRVQLFGQNNIAPTVTVIQPYVLPITFYKTTNLIFPFSVKSVDRGSKDILVQKAKGVENILQVKAGKAGFDQTNLTVITADGKLYSYLLSYVDTPGVLNIRFDDAIAGHPGAFFPNISVNEAQVKAEADTVAMAKETILRLKDKSFGIKMKLNGLYIKGDVLFFRLILQNGTNINYDVDQLRFYIRDAKKWKRTATQELEISPLHVSGDTTGIAGQTEKVFVYALPKFTIPDKKYFAIELMEKWGGRHLKILVHNRTLIRAKLLP